MNAWKLILLSASSLLLACGGDASTPAPAKSGSPKVEAKAKAKASPEAAKATPSKASAGAPMPVKAATKPSPAKAPKVFGPPPSRGTFTGALKGERLSGDIKLVLRGGLLVSAVADVIAKQRVEFKLKSLDGGDTREVSLRGNVEDVGSLTVRGRFIDDERAAGIFEGTINRKRVDGRWYAIRR